MTSERQPGQPAEGQVPFGGGKNAPQPAEPQATHGPPEGHGAGSNAALDKQRPPEAAHPPPEISLDPQAIEVEVVDIAKLQAEKREQQRVHKRAYVRRRYHDTKQAALSGDEEAQKRWQRMQEQNREGQRRWRARHPEEHRAYQREHYRRKKLQAEESLDSRVDKADASE